jgi:hypothetical protein
MEGQPENPLKNEESTAQKINSQASTPAESGCSGNSVTTSTAIDENLIAAHCEVAYRSMPTT